MLFLTFQGLATLPEAARFFGVVVAGNTVGGVLLVALLNYSQTRQQRFPHRDCDPMALTWREWKFGIGRGKAAREAASENAPLTRDESIGGAETGSMLDQPVQRPAREEPEVEPEGA